MSWHGMAMEQKALSIRTVARIDEVWNARCTTGPGQGRQGIEEPVAGQAMTKRDPDGRGIQETLVSGRAFNVVERLPLLNGY
jgi:hypothetical protein